jgi:hypothetical protein
LTGSPDYTITAQPASTITGPSGSTTFTVRFAPSSIGAKNAVLSIPNDDTNENPFTINLSGSGVTALTAYNNAISTNSSLTGSNALPSAIPFNDGVKNLLKYAFNMNLSGPDSRGLVSGTGTTGLPAITSTRSGATTTLRVEFIRRIGSGLVYTPKRSSNLSGESWIALTDVPSVTPINASWERVIYEEPLNTASTPKCFGCVEVRMP